MKDASILEVGQLHLCVKAKHTIKLFPIICCHCNIHARLDVLYIWKVDGVPLKASQTQRLSILPCLEAKGNEAHANKVAAMDALKTLRNYSLHSLFKPNM